VVWRDLLAEPVWSNAPLDPAQQLEDSAVSRGHTAVDLGEEEFTVGRLHPMLDNALRIRRLPDEARDPQVAAIVLDVVLGYGAHPDPAAELGPAVVQAKRSAQANGRELIVIASVTGTDADPQNRRRQVERLAAAGVIVCTSNAAAAHLAAQIANRQSSIVNRQSPIVNRQSSIPCPFPPSSTSPSP
jgi:FdrA protein